MLLILGTAVLALACAVARADGHAWMIVAAALCVAAVTWLCVRVTDDWRVQWPVMVCLLCNPFVYDQASLYRLNPELANIYVLPVLLAVQPVLLPLAALAGAGYALTRHRWARAALLIALWGMAIEFLFSMRLEPFAAIAEVHR